MLFQLVNIVYCIALKLMINNLIKIIVKSLSSDLHRIKVERSITITLTIQLNKNHHSQLGNTTNHVKAYIFSCMYLTCQKKNVNNQSITFVLVFIISRSSEFTSMSQRVRALFNLLLDQRFFYEQYFKKKPFIKEKIKTKLYFD